MKTLLVMLLALVSSTAGAREDRPLAPYALLGAWCPQGSSEIDIRITRNGELTLFPSQSSCRIKKITPENDGWWNVKWVCKGGESLSGYLRTRAEWDGDPPTALKNRQLELRTAPTGHGHLITFDDCGE